MPQLCIVMEHAKSNLASGREPDYERLLYVCETDRIRLQKRVAELEAEVRELRRQIAELRTEIASRRPMPKTSNEIAPRGVISAEGPLAW